MEEYKDSPQYKAALAELDGIIRSKNPEGLVDKILERCKNQPFEEEITQKAKNILKEHHRISLQGGKQGIEIICYGLDPQTCQVVFENEEKARRTIGADFSQLDLRKNHYFLSDYAVYGQQARALAELMYQCLYEPSVFNSPLVHNERRMFGRVHILKTGEFVTGRDSDFKGLEEVSNMPTVKEMYDILRCREFFEDIPEIRHIGIKPFINLLNLVLEGRAPQPDEALIDLIK